MTGKEKRGLENEIARIEKLRERLREKDPPKKPAQSAQIIQLPLWGNDKRGTPNSFLRSALFAAIQSKERVYLKDAVLASQKGITVIFTGEQLNQEDLTIWEAIIHLVRERPLGRTYQLPAHSILKTAGMHTGQSQHKQLRDHLKRLTAAFVEITQEGGVEFMGHLINSVVKEPVAAHYEIEVNESLIELYKERRWTPLDVEIRRQLRNHPLALALHAHYDSHDKPFPYKLETLASYVGSKNASAAAFKQKVKKALQKLVDAGFLEGFDIDRGGLVIVKKHGIRDI